jgi:hypothetical protein
MLSLIHHESGMASSEEAVAAVIEHCRSCGRETAHDVTLTILTESTKRENASFSREPYRVSTCRSCGTTTRTRMNDA